ncbi:MAG: ATP-binding protein [Candidatus Gracilibacteria bacterium]|nr:ATP-binding protein [Candidatus Gracilibacteria bacterium]
MKYKFLFEYIHKGFRVNNGYIRNDYITKIILSIGSNTIKVLSGVRRVGKSYILKQTIDHLIKEKNININNIFYIHLEDERLNNISINQLREIWEEYKSYYYKSGVIYAFFDEIQNISSWEKFIRNLQETFEDNIQIFITGSNSNLLSSELSTVLTGRYIKFEIYPFSFSDYLGLKNIVLSEFDSRKYELFEDYIKYGSLPEVIKINDNEIKTNYLKSLTESIIFKDIVQRYNIKKTQFLESLLIYIYKTTCSNLSINSIVKYLKQEYKTLDYETVNSYIDNITNTFLINNLPSIADKTKHILKGKNKFYAIDTGIRNIYSNNFDIEKILETFVFIELKRQGYEVQNIEGDNFEIDFIAKKDNDIKLIQVSYTLTSQSTFEREINALKKSNLSYEKIILTMDKINNNIDGIKIINIVDFILNENFK